MSHLLSAAGIMMSSSNSMESSRMMPFLASSPTPRSSQLSVSTPSVTSSATSLERSFPNLSSPSSPFNLSYAAEHNLLAAAQHYSNHGELKHYCQLMSL